MSEFLEITTKIGCSVNCLKYCPQEVLLSKYDGPRAMSLDAFKEIIRTVPKTVEITFSGFCEPFLNPDTAEMIVHAYEEGHGVQLFTTLVGCTYDDYERIKNVEFSRILLHLPDANGVAKIPITREYCELLPIFLKRWQCQTVAMNERFPTNRREDHARTGLPFKPYPISCDKLCERQHVVLPNGNVYQCCYDFGLNDPVGNLLEDSYQHLKPLKKTRTCRHSDLAMFTPFYLLRGVVVKYLFAGGR